MMHSTAPHRWIRLTPRPKAMGQRSRRSRRMICSRGRCSTRYSFSDLIATREKPSSLDRRAAKRLGEMNTLEASARPHIVPTGLFCVARRGSCVSMYRI